jgi:hypothetical protein
VKLPPIAMSLVLVATVACGVTDPKTDPSGPTILVINATCAAGACAKFEVRGWEGVFVVPGQPPAGFIRVGEVDLASACLRFPDSVQFTGAEVDSLGHVVRADTTYWTPKNSIGLTALALGAGAFSPPLAYADSEIVPANSPGWQITFPSGDVAPSAPCRP